MLCRYGCVCSNVGYVANVNSSVEWIVALCSNVSYVSHTWLLEFHLTSWSTMVLLLLKYMHYVALGGAIQNCYCELLLSIC